MSENLGTLRYFISDWLYFRLVCVFSHVTYRDDVDEEMPAVREGIPYLPSFVSTQKNS